ncbi:hypothetical protein AUJ46_02585 [Candidatus Peregrinibacteria bacterium CG1_02_54_53]|nr:MAG: hypothetical protein AUJ46_02585 [Candidatus Peregrinibacteria bacterium CG1_02_54_53]
MASESPTDQIEALDPISALAARGDFEGARERCSQVMAGGPLNSWLNIIDQAEACDRKLHDRDPRSAKEIAKKIEIDGLRKHFMSRIQILTQQLEQSSLTLAQSGYPNRADRVAQHLPKKPRKQIRRTLKQDGKHEKAEQQGENSPVKEILDAVDTQIKAAHWNTKKPAGLSGQERAVLSAIVQAHLNNEPHLTRQAVGNITGLKNGAVSKAMRNSCSYRLKDTKWRIEEQGEEIIFSPLVED